MTNETKNYYAPINYSYHSTFGGNVYNYDFDGYNSISSIASRIMADMKFDRQCMLSAQNRDKNKKFKKGNIKNEKA